MEPTVIVKNGTRKELKELTLMLLCRVQYSARFKKPFHFFSIILHFIFSLVLMVNGESEEKLGITAEIAKRLLKAGLNLEI